MKRIKQLLLTSVIVTIHYCAVAQTTNTFPASGNVGIGTTSPANLLHITGNAGSADMLRLNTTDATDGRSTILFISAKGPQTWQFGQNPGGGAGIFGLRDMTTSGFPVRFVVNTSGYFGIGTITPVTLLNVAVPSAKTTVAGNVVSFLSTNDASNAFGLRTMIYGGAAIANRYATLQTTDYSLVDGGSLVLQPSTGNVGIGTTAPNVKLDVMGSFLVRGSGTYAYNNPGSADLQIGYGLAAPNTAGTVTRLALQPYGHTGGPWKFDARDISGAAFLDIYYGGQGAGTGLTLNSSGNVGIGTTTPDQMLSVNGTIHSKAVVVDLNGWPDYVFKKDYSLLPLSEVKNYIDQNQHLPDMPSEQEMIKNGLNVSEMNKLLTKKVEELTLYLIEKDKKDVDQQKEIDELKSQVKALLEKSK